MTSYGFIKNIDGEFVSVEKMVTQELKNEGFGVLTKIDIKEKFKEKLGIDYQKYIILGACSPPNAFKALEFEENIGLMLPCNIIIHQKNDKVTVGIIKPSIAMGMIDNPDLRDVAAIIEQKLKSVFEKI